MCGSGVRKRYLYKNEVYATNLISSDSVAAYDLTTRARSMGATMSVVHAYKNVIQRGYLTD